MLLFIQLAEQSNFVTDLIFATVLWLLSQKMSEFEGNSLFIKAWKQYFILTGAGALIGGFGHLFSFYLGMNLKVASWVIGLFALYFLEKDMLQLVKLPSFLNYILISKLLIFSALSIYFKLFTYTKTGITIGMVGIVCTSLYYFYQKTNIKSYFIVLGGVLGNGIGGIIHALNLQFSEWFNGGDIAHLISCVCFWGIYVGLKNINAAFPLAVE
jgi:hypothetical protein